jgi:PIN domain nuclease of toxin-antitoxin system
VGVTVLLDTHALLWSLLSPDLLSPKARSIIVDRSNTVLVSAASAWEIATKHRLGKLDHATSVVTNYFDHLATLGADEVPISSAQALTAGRFAAPHRDRFDRMIAAQAMLLNVPVVTKDEALLLFPCDSLW